ncbi:MULTISPECIES: hypothetical protein [unclassified Okeania]|uniref:hypothetical protein n=1 Tax=unclassified Okeania TaxID=2634635 RepID=UPI0013BBEE01|nr:MULTISPECIES: hypothetical protein [unclassified Okeania]NEP39032.1 hypothetical protein [Okeania sp. SIO2H7]NEP74305.1 hypothetical protein [Okeania sp. SIO2G5]NEP96421.1 hypothetical protein [Okeania sp. SIO2F5]NEQ93116.1 hypothetical protein [Okeania sp. SIO2G4]
MVLTSGVEVEVVEIESSEDIEYGTLFLIFSFGQTILSYQLLIKICVLVHHLYEKEEGKRAISFLGEKEGAKNLVLSDEMSAPFPSK